jgi:hypothetical protein
MQDLINKITQGYGTKEGKRGILVTTEDGTSLDCLLEWRGKQAGEGDGPELVAKAEATQYCAVVSKSLKPTLKVREAAGVKAARAFLASQAKAVAARKPKAAAPATPAKPKAQRKSGVKVTK